MDSIFYPKTKKSYWISYITILILYLIEKGVVIVPQIEMKNLALELKA